MTGDEMRVGLIGCGNISQAYLALAPSFAGFRFTKVADLRLDAAEARAAEFGVAAVSVADLLTSPDIDIVVNLTVPAAHFEVTRTALENGKHVWSEKPFVLNLDEGEALRRLSETSGLRVGSAPDTWLGGTHQFARHMIDGGHIGRIVAGSCHVMSHGMEDWHPSPEFFFLPGGGPVLDLGPYYISNLIQLIGPIRRVMAMASAATPTRTLGTGPREGERIPVETPTNVHALLEFHGGATITFSASWDVWAHKHSNMELYGTEGSLFLPDPNFFGGVLEVAGRDGRIGPVALWDHPLGRPNREYPSGHRACLTSAPIGQI
jgi:predicted dehydrogenase